MSNYGTLVIYVSINNSKYKEFIGTKDDFENYFKGSYIQLQYTVMSTSEKKIITKKIDACEFTKDSLIWDYDKFNIIGIKLNGYILFDRQIYIDIIKILSTGRNMCILFKGIDYFFFTI